MCRISLLKRLRAFSMTGFTQTGIKHVHFTHKTELKQSICLGLVWAWSGFGVRLVCVKIQEDHTKSARMY